MKRPLVLLGFAAVLTVQSVHAGPSVWSKARDPDEDARATLLEQAEALMMKRKSLRRARVPSDLTGVADLYLREAKKILERAGADASPNMTVRQRYAEVLNELRDPAGCARAYEALLKMAPPPLVRAQTYAGLGICYAHLHRRADEIKAYDRALTLETHSTHRATLMANRAEALMATGDLTGAAAGYRTALAALSTTHEMHVYAPTTYWGLAVALDRSGELEAAFEAVRLARTYDPTDSRINGTDWFYSPDYDEAWYRALGSWQRARVATLAAARNEAYDRAIEGWDEYLLRAPPDDRYLPIARARLKVCAQERAEARKRPPSKAPASKG